MAQQQPLLSLLHENARGDYVSQFQALARVNLAIRSEGPTAELLMQKAILENDLGNYEASVRSAGDALVIEPALEEAHFQRGVSYFMLALVKARIATTGPSIRRLPRERVKTLLVRAKDEFKEAVKINPQDTDASEDLGALRALLSPEASEHEIIELLRQECRRG